MPEDGRGKVLRADEAALDAVSLAVGAADHLAVPQAAPATSIDMTLVQWSRPASLLMTGARPNSPSIRTRVLSRRPRSSRSFTRANIARSTVGRIGVSPFSMPPPLDVVAVVVEVAPLGADGRNSRPLRPAGGPAGPFRRSRSCRT